MKAILVGLSLLAALALPVLADEYEASEQIANDPAAAGMLKREYRAPWKHPFGG